MLEHNSGNISETRKDREKLTMVSKREGLMVMDQGLPKILRAPIYKAHRAFIFAIAQRSRLRCQLEFE